MRFIKVLCLSAVAAFCAIGSTSAGTIDFEGLSTGSVGGDLVIGDVTISGTRLSILDTDCDTLADCNPDPDLATGTPFGTSEEKLVLITAQPNDENNDDPREGVFSVTISKMAKIFSVTLVDIEPVDDSSFKFDGSSVDEDSRTSQFASPRVGDNTNPLNVNNNVTTYFFDGGRSLAAGDIFEVDLGGSGALARIDYSVVPLPAGAVLMISALGLLGAAARRRKS